MSRKPTILLATSIAIALPSVLHAQAHAAHANVNVFVSATQSLVVSNAPSRAAVSSKIDNRNNVRLGDVRQINVFSNGKFVLKVSARDDFNELSGVEIPTGAVFVSSSATVDSKEPGDIVFEKDVPLAVNNPKTLIHSQTAGTLNTSFNIEYYASGINVENLHSGYLDGLVVYTIEVE